jgi:hypothetical protein
MNHTELVKLAEAELKVSMILAMRFGDGGKEPNLQLGLAKNEIMEIIKSFATTIRENDKEEFRGMMGEKEVLKIKQAEENPSYFWSVIGKNDFRSELTTKLEKWK